MRVLLIAMLIFGFGVNGASQDELKWKEEVDKLKHDGTPFYSDNEMAETIVLTGSSSARLWKDFHKLFPEDYTKNTGFGGSQMHELKYYLEELVIGWSPNKILIYEGDNDVNAGKSSEEIMKSTKEVVALLQEKLPNSEIFFISPKPSLARWSLAEKYIDINQKLEAYCAANDKVTYIDVWFPMLNDQGTPIEQVFIEDGLHMNEMGYKIWEKAVKEKVK